MRVVLRHAEIGLYYAGRKHWVSDQGAALDLRSIERAIELSREESFVAMEIMVCYDDPTCELVLPIGRKKSGGEESMRMAA
jgi:hypothetical protein